MKSIAFLAFLALVSAVPVPFSSFSSPYSAYGSGYYGGFYGDSSVGIYHKLEEAESYVAAAVSVPELHSVPEYTTIIKFLEEGKHYVETALLSAHAGYDYSSFKSVIYQTKLAQEAFYHAYQVAEEVGLPVVAEKVLYAYEAVRAAYFFADHVYTRYYPSSGYSYIRSLIPDYFSKSSFGYSGYSPASWGYSGSFPSSYSSYYPFSSWFSSYFHPSSYGYSGYSPYSSYSSYAPWSSYSSYFPYSSYSPYSSYYRSGSYWPYSYYGSYSPKSSFYGPYSSYLYGYPHGSSSSIYGSLYGSYGSGSGYYGSGYGSYGSGYGSYGYGSSVVPHIFGLFGKSYV